MPTGVALPDASATLYAAAERVLLRDGPSALTTRSVTEESGVSKGVLHKHFADFDTFLAGFAGRQLAKLDRAGDDLVASAGRGPVVERLGDALVEIFTPATLGIVTLVISRDALRNALRATTPHGIPILAQARMHVARYLAAERDLGRIDRSADVDSLALALIGTGHLLFAGELGARPDRSAVDEAVESIMVGLLRSS